MLEWSDYNIWFGPEMISVINIAIKISLTESPPIINRLYTIRYRNRIYAGIISSVLEYFWKRIYSAAVYKQHILSQKLETGLFHTCKSFYFLSWWRHQIQIFSASLAICTENSPVPVEFPPQRPLARSFDVFFNLRLNKRLSKQS